MSKFKKFIYKRNVLIFVLILLIVLTSLLAVYFYNQYKKNQNPTLAAQSEVSDLISKVGNLMVLPSGETPQIATVSDKSKLSDQPFFANAENGDKVLIYAKAARAILYRPSINKIIEVAPLNLTGQTAPNPSPSQALAKTYKVEIYNGSKTAGLAKTTAQKLSSQLPNVQIVGTSNASGDYQKTIVVDLKGSGDPFAQQLAKAVNGSLSSLPVGENAPSNADFLVIVGE